MLSRRRQGAFKNSAIVRLVPKGVQRRLVSRRFERDKPVEGGAHVSNRRSHVNAKHTIGGEAPDSADGSNETLMLTPARHDTDGFFVVVVRKAG